MKTWNRYAVALLVAWLMSHTASAQSLKDILNSSTVKDAATALTGGKKITLQTLEGKWVYRSPAVKLKGDNALENIAGSLVTGELEKTLADYCTKVGIIEGVFAYTFRADSTFSNTLKKGSMGGTFKPNTEAGTVELRYAPGKLKKLALTTLTATAVISGDELQLLFNADKLLSLLTMLTSSSDNSTLKTIGNLAKQYEGVQVGFRLTR